MLAPLADVSSGGSGFSGALIAEEHDGAMDIGSDYFEGCLPLP